MAAASKHQQHFWAKRQPQTAHFAGCTAQAHLPMRSWMPAPRKSMTMPESVSSVLRALAGRCGPSCECPP